MKTKTAPAHELSGLSDITLLTYLGILSLAEKLETGDKEALHYGRSRPCLLVMKPGRVAIEKIGESLLGDDNGFERKIAAFLIGRPNAHRTAKWLKKHAVELAIAAGNPCDVEVSDSGIFDFYELHDTFPKWFMQIINYPLWVYPQYWKNWWTYKVYKIKKLIKN